MVLLAQGPWPFETIVQLLENCNLCQTVVGYHSCPRYPCSIAPTSSSSSSFVPISRADCSTTKGDLSEQNFQRTTESPVDVQEQFVRKAPSSSALSLLFDATANVTRPNRWQRLLMGPLVAEAPHSFTAWIQ